MGDQVSVRCRVSYGMDDRAPARIRETKQREESGDVPLRPPGEDHCLCIRKSLDGSAIAASHTNVPVIGTREVVCIPARICART